MTVYLEASQVPNMQSRLRLSNGVEETVPTGNAPPRRPHNEWKKWKPTLQRLYLDENKTLIAIMEIMKTKHNFTSSMKQYKRHFKLWGFRKYIRFSTKDAEELRKSLATIRAHEIVNTNVHLANGMVVDAQRLAAHLHRRNTRVPAGVRPPDRFYFSESALSAIRSFDVGVTNNPTSLLLPRAVGHTSVDFIVAQMVKWATAMTVDDAVTCILQTNGATRRWSAYTRRVDQALNTTQPGQLSTVLALMRRAPDELKHLIQQDPPNLMNSILRFLILLTSRNPVMSDSEIEQVLKMSKTLLRYMSEIMPLDHPLLKILSMVSQVDDEHLNPLMLKGWEVSYNVSAMQNFCAINSNFLSPCEMTLIVDWLVASNIMKGNEPPPLHGLVENIQNHVQAKAEARIGTSLWKEKIREEEMDDKPSKSCIICLHAHAMRPRHVSPCACFTYWASCVVPSYPSPSMGSQLETKQERK